MKQGEIWTVRESGYASKARPVLIIQKDVNYYDSVVLCLLTSFDSSNLPNRVKVDPTKTNGLRTVSYVMTDKIVTVNKKIVDKRVGKLQKKTLDEVLLKVAEFLGIS